VATKLQHPGRRRRWRPHEGEVILVLAEDHGATWAAAARTAGATPVTTASSVSRPARGAARASPTAGLSERFVAAHDLGDLPEPVSTQGNREKRHHRVAPGRREISQAQPLAAEDAAREIRPPGPLRSFGGKLNLRTTRIVERGDNRLRGCNNALCDVGLSRG